MDEPTVKRGDLAALEAEYSDFTILKADNGEFAARNLGMSDSGDGVEFEILGRIVD